MSPKLYIFVLMILSLSLFSHAQQEASVWFVGSDTQINFQSDSFAVIDSGINSYYKASICDENGNLLLYTDGRTIWNGKNEVLINGTNLSESTYLITGNPIFIPYPKKEGHYLLFYVQDLKSSPYLRDKELVYAEIDCHAANNRGEVISKSQFLHNDFHSHPTISGYCNNSHYWLAIDRNDNIHEPRRDRIFFYKIDENGVHTSPLINDRFDIGNSAYYKFSPNGDKLFFAYQENTNQNVYSVVADFNFLTGELYNYRIIFGDIFYSREFSGNSQYLYYFSERKLIQADVRYSTSGKIQELTTTLEELPQTENSSRNGTSLQLAPDGRIYFLYFDPIEEKTKIGRINYPNKKGLDCGVELNFYTPKETLSFFPNFLTSFLRDKKPEYIDEVIPEAGQELEICSGTSALIGKAEQSPDATYQWLSETYIEDPFSPQTVITAPKFYGGSKIRNYSLRATDGNCWLKFSSAKVTFLPQPENLEIDGSWSVCPFVEGVEYWTDKENVDLGWFVNGGEIEQDPSSDTLKINWMNTNPNASVNAYYTNYYGCISDTAVFPVRINVELITETPKGPQNLCLGDAYAVNYQIRKTNGSVYQWTAEQGEIISGQGTNKVLVNWKTEGSHRLSVNETSTTIDTVCYGESEPLLVEVLNDSLEIELTSVSFGALETIINLSYESTGYNPSQHPLTAIVTDEFGSINYEVSANSFFYRHSEDELNPEIIQLKVVNRCDEIFYSNKQESIVLKNTGYIENSVKLEWNQNRFWSDKRTEDELWHSFLPSEGWEILENFSGSDDFLYSNESLQLDHYFRIKEKNLDEGVESWSNILHVKFDDKITIPDVFTPNGDGINDVWEIRNIGYHDFRSLNILDRYGQKVYSCKNTFVPWDGKTGNGIQQGTYFYELQLGSNNTRYGQITILK